MARTMVIEDDEPSRRLLKDLLSSYGHDVAAFARAEDAVVAAAADPPDIIFLDIRLPGMDGFEALAAFRSTPALSHTRVIAVTASVMLNERNKILAAGFDAYHPKPIQIPELMAQVALWFPQPTNRHQ